MVNRLPETVTGFPAPPFSATDPPPRSRWWTQLHSLFLRRNEHTQEEKLAIVKPLCGGLFTCIAIVLCLIIVINSLHCHVSLSVESISVSPYSATWHVDFLVKNPSSSRCLINYDDDDVYAKLGSLSAAVLKTSHTRLARGLASFSLDFATSNQSDIVAASHRVFELDMKLKGKRRRLIADDEIGHFDIRCQNLMTGHENVKCHSSFKKLKECC